MIVQQLAREVIPDTQPFVRIANDEHDIAVEAKFSIGDLVQERVRTQHLALRGQRATEGEINRTIGEFEHRGFHVRGPGFSGSHRNFEDR